MKNAVVRLIKIGKSDLRSALGFFWLDRQKIYVAAGPEDVAEWKAHGYADIHPMTELESAFRESGPLRFISWCGLGSIVRQGAGQATFTYDNGHKVTVRIR